MTNDVNAPEYQSAIAAKPTAKEIDERIIDVLRHRVGKDERAAKPHDWYTATVLTLRDAIIDRWMESTRETYAKGAITAKAVSSLSATD